MTTPGYPDYARLSLSGGVLLYGSSVAPPVNTAFFQGYVGLWPYMNVFLNCGASVDFVKVIINYYSDSTFTTIVAFRVLVRTGANISATQYSNLTPWAQVFYLTKSAGNFPFLEVALYGASGYAPTKELDSNDVPAFQFDGSIAATTLQTNNIQHVRPGNAQLQVNTSAAAWTVELFYYDYGAGAYKRLLQVSNTSSGKFASLPAPLIDVPMQLQIRNNDASAQVFNVSMMSMGDL